MSAPDPERDGVDASEPVSLGGPVEAIAPKLQGASPGDRQKLIAFAWPRLNGQVKPTISQDRLDVINAFPDIVRDRLASPEFAEALIEGWLPMLKRGDRSARAQFLEATRLTGTGDRLAEALLQALGATLPVARQALEVQRDAGSLASDPEAMRARAEGYLLREYRANPALVERSPLGEVFGQRVTVQEDRARGEGDTVDGKG